MIKIKLTDTGKVSLKLNRVVISALEEAIEIEVECIERENAGTKLQTTQDAKNKLYYVSATELYLSLKPKIWAIKEVTKIQLSKSQAYTLFLVLTKYDSHHDLLQLKQELHRLLLV